MPRHGIDSVVVPGVVDAWDALLKRAGTLTFKELLQPAADLAACGFAVSERIQRDWVHGAPVLALDVDSAKTYLVDGKPPAIYSVFRNPDLARTFRILQAQGRDGFYKGEIGAGLLAKSRALGGTLDEADLEAARADWVAPISTAYHGYEVYEFPPSTQGFAVLEMLNILEVAASRLGLDLKTLGPKSPLYWHLLVEAKKLAYADLYAYNADPQFEPIPLSKLNSKSYAAELCGKIDLRKAHTPLAQTISLAAQLLRERHSTRDFDDQQPITIAELSRFLDGAARVQSNWTTTLDPGGGGPTLAYTSRPYPSGGSSYELELYLAVDKCEGLERGFYHYDPAEHALMPIATRPQEFEALLKGAEQAMGAAAVPQILITIAARFGRISWKYSSIAYALILKDVGVLLQTLYLMATDLGLGGCAIGTTNIDLFEKMTGIEFHIEGAVGQFALGRGAKSAASDSRSDH